MGRSRIAVSACVIVIVTGCGARTPIPASAAPVQQPKGLVFIAPTGFEEHPEKHLYYHPKFRASISPAYNGRAKFDEVAAEFTEEVMRAHGMALNEKTMKDVGGRKTLVLKGDRLNGKYPQVFTTVVFPTQHGVAQLTAIYPTDSPIEIQERIDSAILNARYNE